MSRQHRKLKLAIYAAVLVTCTFTLHMLTQTADNLKFGRKDRSLQEYDVQSLNDDALRFKQTIQIASATRQRQSSTVAEDKESTTGFGQTQPVQAGFLRPRFTYLREPAWLFNDACETEICGRKKKHKWSMVNFIKSAAGNFIRRELLRRTWGGMRNVESGRFTTIFVIGRASGNTAKLLLEECRRYGDIMIFDGPDDYKSMPMKTLAAMQWAHENLPHDYFYSSGDDDFMINVGRLQEIIDEGITNVTSFRWPEFPVVCTYKTIESAQPYRNKTGIYKKWFISEEEYKWPFYPKSCLGGFYTTSISVVGHLYRISRSTPHLSVDDVWITGILREKLGMPDDMVITPNKTIAHHFLGYKKKRNDIKIGFMKNEWRKIYDEFRAKEICTC